MCTERAKCCFGWYSCATMFLQSHYNFSSFEQMALSGMATKRLLMACAMGGAVGVEREYRHKDSGLRTDMLICMGAVLFTLLSAVLAGDGNHDKGRVAGSIVQPT